MTPGIFKESIRHALSEAGIVSHAPHPIPAETSAPLSFFMANDQSVPIRPLPATIYLVRHTACHKFPVEK